VRDLDNIYEFGNSIFYFVLNKTNKNNMGPVRGA
jgi:hypothetical protein